MRITSLLATFLPTLLAAATAHATVTIGTPGDPATPADATPLAVLFGGNTQYDGWSTSGISGLSGYPGFPGSGAWPAPIGSNLGGDAGLNKTANGTGGGPYPASGSIYYGGFSGDPNNDGGQLTVTDSTPVANVKTILFQVEIGEAWTYDFWNQTGPQLTLNTSEGNFTFLATQAAYSEKIIQAYTGTVEMPSGEEPVYINLWGYQWDTSTVTAPIISFSIAWNGVQHAQLYALRLDQTDTAYSSNMIPQAIPEPSTWALIGLALTTVVVLRKKQRLTA